MIERLVLAPMGLVSGGALAAAVSRAGGLGLIGGGYGDADWMRREFRQAEGARVGIGFITWSLAKQPELLDLALSYKPCAVMLSFGDPRPFAEKIRQSGAKLLCQVQSLAIARQALEARPDVLVAQGTEAGGHGGERSLFALLPAVRDLAIDRPVLAAGGIADRRGYDAAVALGAAGVLVGTRFSAANEALTAAPAKKRIVEASGDATVRTTVFDVVRGFDGWAGTTGRALRNKFTDRWHGREAELVANQDAEGARYRKAVERQDFDTALIFAGEAVDLIDSVLPAAELVRRIVH
ncbi:MAG TPA: nitronate monooxygenase [Burkholderiales bacterium]|nr:nitronate monooxygenase [Burkholderiales bacterium]